MEHALHGSVATNYTTHVTHVVCKEPQEDGRILFGIAAGKWIVDHTYAEESFEEGESGNILVDLDLITNFIVLISQEEEFQWRNGA